MRAPRPVAVRDVVDTPWEAIESALRPLIVDDETASEVLSSLYEIGWVPLDSPATTYSEGFDLGDMRTVSWRAACDFVAGARGRGESYMDVVWDLDYSLGVSDRVARLMRSLGLRPVE